MDQCPRGGHRIERLGTRHGWNTAVSLLWRQMIQVWIVRLYGYDIPQVKEVEGNWPNVTGTKSGSARFSSSG